MAKTKFLPFNIFDILIDTIPTMNNIKISVNFLEFPMSFGIQLSPISLVFTSVSKNQMTS